MVNDIIDAVCSVREVDPALVLGRSKAKELSEARAAIWAILSRRGMGLAEISRRFHVTKGAVLPGVRRADQELIEKAEKILSGAHPEYKEEKTDGKQI